MSAPSGTEAAKWVLAVELGADGALTAVSSRALRAPPPGFEPGHTV